MDYPESLHRYVNTANLLILYCETFNIFSNMRLTKRVKQCRIRACRSIGMPMHWVKQPCEWSDKVYNLEFVNG